MKKALVLFLVISGISTVWADTVIFRNGQEVDGRIINQNRTTITIRTQSGAVRNYQKSEIARIAYGDSYRNEREEIKKKREEQERRKQEQLEKERKELERLQEEQRQREEQARKQELESEQKRKEKEAELERQRQEEIKRNREKPRPANVDSFRRHSLGMEIYSGATDDTSPYIEWSTTIDNVSLLFGDAPRFSQFSNSGAMSITGAHFEYLYNRFAIEMGGFSTSQAINGTGFSSGQARPFTNPDGSVTDPGITDSFSQTTLNGVNSDAGFFRLGYSLFLNSSFEFRLFIGGRNHTHSASILEISAVRFSLVPDQEIRFSPLTLESTGSGGETGVLLNYFFTSGIPWQLQLQISGGDLTGQTKLEGLNFSLSSAGGSGTNLDGFSSETESTFSTGSLTLYGNVWQGLSIFVRLATYEIETRPLTFEPAGALFEITDFGAYLIQSQVINAVAATNLSGTEEHNSIQMGLRYQFDFL